MVEMSTVLGTGLTRVDCEVEYIVREIERIVDETVFDACEVVLDIECVVNDIVLDAERGPYEIDILLVTLEILIEGIGVADSEIDIDFSMAFVFDGSKVFDRLEVFDGSKVSDGLKVLDRLEVLDGSKVSDRLEVFDRLLVLDGLTISDRLVVFIGI